MAISPTAKLADAESLTGLTKDDFSDASSASVQSTATSHSTSTASYLIQSAADSHLHHLPAPLSAIRAWLLHRVQGGNGTVAEFQRVCGVKLLQSTLQQSVSAPKHEQNSRIKPSNSTHSNGTHGVNGNDSEEKIRVNTSSSQHYAITAPVLHVYFSVAAAMGNELFYILFLPLLFWLIDNALARRVILMWCVTYYVGQYLKDLLQLPRPASPLVAKLETHYETEFGFPSTHAMIALTLPACILNYTHPQYHYSLTVGAALAMLWTLSITFSRLYNGVHSLADVVGGLLLGLLILVPVLFYQNRFDHWLTQSPSPGVTVATLLVIAAVLIAIYPRPKRWTNCYGDTTIIIGVAIGVFIGSAIDDDGARYQSLHNQLSIKQHTAKFLYYALMRTVLGSACLLTVRAIFKSLTMVVLPPLLLSQAVRFAQASVRPDRIYLTEIPSKFLTYSAVGFCACWIVPRAFDSLGI